MANFEDLLNQYDYDLPQELIAQEPAEPRDSARLLAYNRKANKTSFDTFANITNYLPEKSVLVFNQTKVLPARVPVFRETGGKVVIFYIKTVDDCIEAMVNRNLKIGEKLFVLNNSHSGLTRILSKSRRDSGLSQNDEVKGKRYFIVEKQMEKYFLLKPSFSIDKVYSVLEQYGETPIPPYIKNSPLSENELRQKYQTIFAKEKGSVAAPTASLHFTKQLMEKIKNAGHDIQFVTLHVNLGTFAPLTQEHVARQKLHEEWYEISEETAKFLNKAKAEGRPIIGVGTTVVRTLESASAFVIPDSPAPRSFNEVGIRNLSLPRQDNSQILNQVQDDTVVLNRLTGTTDLFIQAGYQFKFIDGMVTNFHVPKSSLLMLVAALIGRKKLFELYQQAIEKKFKFFSFGDGMLLY